MVLPVPTHNAGRESLFRWVSQFKAVRIALLQLY
jgi:hypothetical protein